MKYHDDITAMPEVCADCESCIAAIDHYECELTREDVGLHMYMLARGALCPLNAKESGKGVFPRKKG